MYYITVSILYSTSLYKTPPNFSFGLQFPIFKNNSYDNVTDNRKEWEHTYYRAENDNKY